MVNGHTGHSGVIVTPRNVPWFLEVEFGGGHARRLHLSMEDITAEAKLLRDKTVSTIPITVRVSSTFLFWADRLLKEKLNVTTQEIKLKIIFKKTHFKQLCCRSHLVKSFYPPFYSIIKQWQFM